MQAAASYEVTGAALRERLQPDPATGARTWWTPDLGPTPVLEILLPASVADAELALAIPRVSQVVVPPSAVVPEMELAKRLSNGCQQDVNCQAELLDQRDAVIRMVYVSEANTFQCTGTLINNPKQDQTPYVLTAAHCARDQARASTLQTMWFYYSQSCNSEGLPASHTERYGGARWLATSFANDMTLLQLNDAPPPGALRAVLLAKKPPLPVSCSEGSLRRLILSSRPNERPRASAVALPKSSWPLPTKAVSRNSATGPAGHTPGGAANVATR